MKAKESFWNAEVAGGKDGNLLQEKRKYSGGGIERDQLEDRRRKGKRERRGGAGGAQGEEKVLTLDGRF